MRLDFSSIWLQNEHKKIIIMYVLNTLYVT